MYIKANSLFEVLESPCDWPKISNFMTTKMTKEITHRGFQDFPTVYSALKMTNDSFKFYFHILLALKFKIIAVIQILLPLKSQTTVIIQILRALKCESKI